MADVPNPFVDRFKGHARPKEDLVVTRPSGSRRVYVGIAGGGYVRLRLEEAAELGRSLLGLADRQR